MSLRRIIAPANPALDLDYVKSKLRVEHDEHDALLESYIAAETGYAEGPDGFTGRALIDQTWDYFLDHFPGCEGGVFHHHHHGWRHHTIHIPLPPLIEVVAFVYQDADGVEQTVDPDLYVVDTASDPGRIVLLQGSMWPTARRAANAIRIRFRAGYLDQTMSPPEDAVPEDIKLGIYVRVYADYGPFDKDASDKIRATGELMLRQKRVQLGMA